MIEKYSHLIQDVGTTVLKPILFAKPNSITILKDISICNQDVEPRKFSLAIVKDSEVLDKKSYLFFETKIDPKETITITGMWCIDPGSEVRFSSDRNDVVSINAFGITVNP